MPVPAVFLDRDGVINENRPNDYVRTLAQFDIFPQALQALCRLAQFPYRVVIVTNQAGVARGYTSETDLAAIHTHLQNVVQAQGGRIDGIWACTHPKEAGCGCRKPQPGMILQAAAALDIDLNQSWLVGDAISDLQAALAAGVRPLLVATGRGATQAAYRAEYQLTDIPLLPDLSAAVDWIINTGHTNGNRS